MYRTDMENDTAGMAQAKGRKTAQEKREEKRAYFEKERTEKKGNFTEFMVRTYYCIYKACVSGDGTSCSTKEVKPYRIKDIVYEGIGYTGQAYRSTIDSCVKSLREMGYLSMKKAENEWMFCLNKPLDFLLDGEHEAYLEKYGITGEAHFMGV